MTVRMLLLSVSVTLAIIAGPARAELVGHWKFDGDLLDSGSLGYDGTFFGGTATYVADRQGNAGSALQIVGVAGNPKGNRVELGTTGRPSNTYTYAAWFQTNDTHEIDAESQGGVEGVSNQKYLFFPSNEGASAGGAGLSVGTNGISAYEHGSSYLPPLAVYDPGDTTTIGTKWNHVAVVYDNKQPTIYLNGQAVRTGFTSPRNTSWAPETIGDDGYGDFNGLVDEAAIFDHALSPVEVERLSTGASPAELAAPLANPSFEADNYTVFPGYASGNGGTIAGWTLEKPSAIGINPIEGGGSPFFNRGVAPDGDQVAFIQRASAISQTALGFEPGREYLITYRENGRGNYASPRASLSLDGNVVVPEHDVRITAAAGPDAFRYVGTPVFTATKDNYRLTLASHNSASDNALVLDDVQIHTPWLAFSDNFDVQAQSYDINPSANDLPGRQGGAVGPLTYTESAHSGTGGSLPELSQLGSTGFPGGLLLGSNRGPATRTFISPDFNFNRINAEGAHYVLEYQVNPGSSSWAAMVFGSSAQDTSVNQSDGVGFLLRDSGVYQVFDGTSGTNVALASGSVDAPGDGWFDVRVNYFVQAFDDLTPVVASVFVEDELVHSFTTDAGFLGNYLTMVSWSDPSAGNVTHGFDNLRLYTTAVPEPSAILLAVFGVLGLAAGGRRRRGIC